MEIEKLPNAHIKNYIQGACDKTNRESKTKFWIFLLLGKNICCTSSLKCQYRFLSSQPFGRIRILRRAIHMYTKVIEKQNIVFDLTRLFFCLFTGENSDCSFGVSIDACLLYQLPHQSSYRVSPGSPASDTQSPGPVGKPPGPLRVKGRISWIFLLGIKHPALCK